MKKALLIGINYKSIPSIALNGCIDDAVNMRSMLIDAYGYNSSDVVMLCDDDKPINQPTVQNIILQLQNLVNQSAKLEEIWIHYSGHGSQIKAASNDEVTGKDQVIIPIDYQTKGVITDNQLLSIIKNIKCRTMLLFDSCHSGTVCDLPWSFQCTPSNTTYTRSQNNNVVITNPNIYMISGCKDAETSADTYSSILREAVGAFSNAFIECLRNSQHNISIMLLYQNVCIYLKQQGYTQVPLLSSSTMNPTYIFNRSRAINLNNTNAKYTIVNTTKSVQTIMKSIIYK